MILHLSDLPLLKWRLLLLLGVLLSGSTAIVASNDYVAHAQSERQASINLLKSANAELASAGTANRNLQDYMTEYEELRNRGILGDERRLDWIEEMESIRKQLRPGSFRYTISPQHVSGPIEKGSPLTANTSLMNFQLGLLHEGQLLDFLGKLRSSKYGLFILESCAMELAAEDRTFPLTANCTGQWLTLNTGNAS